MKPDGRLVKDKDGIVLLPAHFGGQLQPLSFAPGQARRFLAQRQVAQPQVAQDLEPRPDGVHFTAEREGGIYVHVHQLRQGALLPGLVPEADFHGVLSVAGAAAFRAGDFHVRQELDIQGDLACPVADRAAEGAGIIGKVPGAYPQLFGRLGPAVDLAQLVMDVRVGGHRRAHVDPDGGSVDQLDVTDALRLQFDHVIGHLFPAAEGVQGVGAAAAKGQGHIVHAVALLIAAGQLRPADTVEIPGGEQEAAFLRQGRKQALHQRKMGVQGRGLPAQAVQLVAADAHLLRQRVLGGADRQPPAQLWQRRPQGQGRT